MKSTITKILSLIALLVWMSSNVSAQTLEEALDISGYTFTTGGTSNWTGQTAESSDGVDAAVSGALPANNSGTSWLMVEVTLPVSVKFTWKKTGYDVDGYFQTSTSSDQNANWRTLSNLQSSNYNWLDQELVIAGSGKTFLRWTSQSYYNNNPQRVYLDKLSIEAINTVSQVEALDAPGIVLESNFPQGNANAWIGQTNISYDGVDALMSPNGTSEGSWIQTAIDGPSEVSFYWKTAAISSDTILSLESPNEGSNSDILASLQSSIDWSKVNVIIPEGSHTIRWKRNSGGYYNANNSGLVDKLEIKPITDTVSINEALDNSDLDFTTIEGRWSWFGRKVNGAEGGDALISPTFSYSSGTESPQVEATLVGPISLSFRWKIEKTNSTTSYNYSDNNLVCLLQKSDGTTNDQWITAASLNLQSSNVSGLWKEEFVQVPSGAWRVKWQIRDSSYYSSSNSGSVVAYLDKVTTEALTTVSLNDALDTDAFIFTTSSNELGWFGLPGIGENGTDGAQSSIVSVGEKSWIRTYVTGPGTLFYRWKSKSSYNSQFSVHLAWDRFLQPKYGFGRSLNNNDTWESESLPIPSGTYLVEWSVTSNNYENSLMIGYLNQISFTSEEPIDLGEALDAAYFDWISGSASDGVEWFGQSTTSSDQEDAAMTPFVPFGETAWLQTSVRGPGVLSYKAKLPSDNTTVLSLYRAVESENPQWSLSKSLRTNGYGGDYNSNVWYKEFITIPEGVHYLAWQLERGYSGYYSGSNSYNEPHVYIDNVQFEHTGLWAGAVPMVKDISYSPWYGFIYLTDSGWIYHFHHGWQWFYSNDSGNIWLYDLAMGWLWTTKDFYPSLFHAESGKILLYEKESHNPRRFQDTTTNEWMEIE